ncbi:serine-rich adhesin for platelets-like isoform X3 [Oncorhynchus clarkii lewisi]|uniref:serine-rich adhesin for platelets-like isoform X3 n=1 Tax=Oncorhynchus clarkii lewisi TaxID=490388 RepID=UPI0039B8B1E9
MNSPRRDNKSSPVVPPRPSSEEMSNPTAHRLNKENDTSSNSQRTGMMGVMQKVNPFKTTTQVTTSASSTASTATDPVSEKTLDGNVPEAKQNLGVFKGVTQKVNPFRSSTQVRKEDPPKDTVDQEKLPEGKQVFQNPGMFTGMMQKVNPFKSTAQTQSIHSDLSSSAGSLAENTTTERQVRKEDPSTDTVDHQVTAKLPEAKQNPGMFTGMMQKVNPFKSTAQNQVLMSMMDTQAIHSNLSSSADSLASTGRQVIKDDPLTDCVDHHTTEKLPESKPQQNPGMFMGMMQKANPFKSTTPIQDTQSIHSDLSSSSGSLAESNSSAGKQNPGMFKGMMQKVNPFKSTALTQETQPSYSDSSSSSDSLSDTSVFSPAENQTVWYTDNEATSSVKSGPPPPQENKKRTGTFQIRRILPGALFGYEAKNTDAQPTAQAGLVDVQTLEMAAVPVPGEGNPPDSEDKEEGLMDWWQTVEGWETWKESNTFDADEGEMAVEAVADRVFMAARLFVRLFNQRGASLQQRILELLSLADAADSFHKKTVKASVGGGVASVAGSITTITGLILAPFTMGTSLIVTAVGIGVATAGGVASASANITDTVHSKTDRKKVEKMIQDYQEEMKDIKECLDFLQVGMETLEEWDFDQYVDSISKKYLNQNVKHVMKEGGRAGKALLINTESLINTVQVLNVAGGAAKAAQVMSVTTGVMSGLFLALDVFFLAKDSIELNKGAKTEFAGKIREVCKDLQNGLLELNRIKEQLQKTMDGIEVVEEEEEEEEVYESDPEKLAQLEE